MCSRSCSIAPALKVSPAAITTEYLDSFNKCANFARVVVLPVPFIPKNTIKNGSFFCFFSSILWNKSTFPALSNSKDIV